MARVAMLGMTVLLAATAACSGSAADVSKDGGRAAPVTLRLGTNDGPGRLAADDILAFAERVRASSGGTLLVEPVWQAAGRQQQDWDQAVARLVVQGELDLALVPTRAWDTEGVTTLRALQAPFLLTSPDAVTEVVSGELADELMSGLAAVDVTGLALVPESLRRVYSFGSPVLHPTDLDGSVVRAPTSEMTAALFAAFGAGVDDPLGDAFGQRVRDGEIAAAESSMDFTSSLPAPTTVTADLVLFPKINVLVIGDEVLEALDEDQRAVLRTAAEDTRDAAAHRDPAEAGAAARFCAGGGRVALAGPAGLAEFRRAAAPVYAELDRDAQASRLVQQLRQIAERSPAPPSLPGCGPVGVEPAYPSPALAQGAFPEGTFRTQMTQQELLDAGVDAGAAGDLAGINDLRFQGGRWHHSIRSADPSEDCGGPYDVVSGRLEVRISDCGGVNGVLFSAAWRLDGAELTFEDVRSETDPQPFADAVWGGRTWQRIG